MSNEFPGGGRMPRATFRVEKSSGLLALVLPGIGAHGQGSPA
jgi:hypothetical protein